MREGGRLVEAGVDAGAFRLDLVLADRAQMQAELGVLDPVRHVDGDRGDEQERVVERQLDPLRVEVELRQRDAVRAADEAPVVEQDARDHQQRDRRDDEGRPAHLSVIRPIRKPSAAATTPASGAVMSVEMPKNASSMPEK